MPWTTDDVKRHKKNLSEKQEKIWVKVANSALKKCQAEGEPDCEASAIRQANAAVDKIGAQGHIPVSVARYQDFDDLQFGIFNEEKGIYALKSDDMVVEYYFDMGEPFNWTEEDVKKSRVVIAAKGGFINEAPIASVIKYLPDEELPDEVLKARDRFKSPNGGDVFIRRVALQRGRFEIGNGKKVYFSQEFYDKMGPDFRWAPIYKGHYGIGGSDYRDKIGVIICYQNVGGNPYFWIHLYDDQVITNILKDEEIGAMRELEGLNPDEETYGQFSIEAYATEEKEHEGGYKEPIRLFKKYKGMALVKEAGARGTRVEPIAAEMQAMEEIATSEIRSETMSEEIKKLQDASAEDLRGHEKFREAVLAETKELAAKEFDGENVLTEIVLLAADNTEAFNELATKRNEKIVAYYTPADVKGKLFESEIAAEELPWIKTYEEHLQALSADKIAGLPNFMEAVSSLGVDALKDVPAVKELTAQKGVTVDEVDKMITASIGRTVQEKGFGKGDDLIYGTPEGTTEEERKKRAERERFDAIAAKSKTEGPASLGVEEYRVIRDKAREELLELTK